MGKHKPPHPLSYRGTIGNLCFYFFRGENLVRTKSSLTGKRVKTDKKFKETMKNAGLLGRASKLGSEIYAELPAPWRHHWMYRSFVGEAFLLLRLGKSEFEIKSELLKTYVAPVLITEPIKFLRRTRRLTGKRHHRRFNKKSIFNKLGNFVKNGRQFPNIEYHLEIELENTSFRTFNYAPTG